MSDPILQEIKKKKWHHDIKKIEGQWIEDVVGEYQRESNLEKKEILLRKILDNYSIFRPTWAKAYGQYLDNDAEAGKLMHDEIVWRSANKFNISKCKKIKGTAFNAYLVSSQMNWLKNLRNARMSHKNHPRVVCPICGEHVFQIDHQHLKHKMTLDRYTKAYPEAMLSNYDGKSVNPMEDADNDYYTVERFWKEHPEARPSFPVICPISGLSLNEIDEHYTSTLFKGYTEEEFVADFPDFKGIITCPFTRKKKLTITQDYLDEVLNQGDKRKILNPYTGKMVRELTLQMLRDAGVSVHEHIYKNATIVLGKKYSDLVRCPFTGRRTFCTTEEDIKKLNKSQWEFYTAVCKYPLKPFKVKCEYCNQLVDNIWDHLETSTHSYADIYTPEDFSRDYSSITTRAFVSTNCFFESDSGDTTHISDLVSFCFDSDKGMEIEDSLLHVAEDEIDKQIASSVRRCQTMEDIYDVSVTRNEVAVEPNFDMKDIRHTIRKKTGNNDFDVTSNSDNGKIIVSFPSKDTIRKRLQRMIEASDLYPNLKEHEKCQTTKTSY